MKNLLRILTLSILTVLFSFNTNAQTLTTTSKGNFLVGGTLGFSSSNSNIKITTDGIEDNQEGPKNTIVTFEPTFAYFIFKNFAAGGQVKYSLQSTNLGGDKTTDSDLLVGPLLRYYIPVGPRSAVFFESDAAFGASADNLVINGETTNVTNSVTQIGFGPGITIFSNNAIGIEALAKYNHIRSSADINTGAVDIKTVNATNEFDFQVGLQFYFSRVKRAQ